MALGIRALSSFLINAQGRRRTSGRSEREKVFRLENIPKALELKS